MWRAPGRYAGRMSSVAPEAPAAARGISRRTQSDIYRAGISGTKPRVPVDSDALEQAERKALSPEAFAYIAGGAGADHGGRQVDQSVPTIAVLPEIADRVAGRVPIVFDSGVRQGSDAAIALSLGATAVAIGRPYAYGLGIAGEEGVTEVLRNLLAELDITLGLSGHTAISDLDRTALRDATG